jgi:peptidoglycan/LPS O-acetylase OafA/YrhL
VRNRYFDLLRAAAILRVVVYHATGWSALTIAFPAMGVMFALAGSLMAASLDRHGVRALLRRARRLLPPLWALAALMVPAMILTGLHPTWRLVYWLLPLQDPPTTPWGGGVLGIVWYLREYLWFVLLSPLALPLFRRWPLPTLAMPAGVLVAMELGVPRVPVLKEFAIFFGCWLIGFAHHDGRLRRMNRWLLVGLAVAVSGLGAAWFLTHPSHRGYDLNDIPLGDSLWSTGFVLLLIGLAPANIRWLDRWHSLSSLVTALNRRAVTVYLWHLSVIVGLGLALGAIGWSVPGPVGMALWIGAVGFAVCLPVAAFGWIEDLAAGRRIRSWSGVPAPRTEAPSAPERVEALAGASVDATVPGPREAGDGAVGDAEWSGARLSRTGLPRRRGRTAGAEAGRVRSDHHAADPAPRAGPGGRQGRTPDDVPVRGPAGAVRPRRRAVRR